VSLKQTTKHQKLPKTMLLFFFYLIFFLDKLFLIFTQEKYNVTVFIQTHSGFVILMLIQEKKHLSAVGLNTALMSYVFNISSDGHLQPNFTDPPEFITDIILLKMPGIDNV